MKKIAAIALTASGWVVLLGTPLGFVYYVLAGLGWAPSPYTCLTETRMRIAGPAGAEIEVSQTDCDALAKEFWIDVYISKPGSRKTRLIQYDPSDVEMPDVWFDGEHVLHIDVGSPAAIFCRRDTWNDLSVVYEIGKIHFPSQYGSCKR